MNIEPNLNFNQEKKDKIKSIFIRISNLSDYATSAFIALQRELFNELNCEYIGTDVFYRNSTTKVDFKQIHDLVGYKYGINTL